MKAFISFSQPAKLPSIPEPSSLPPPLLPDREPGIKAPYGKHLAGHLRLIAPGNVLTFIEMRAVMSQTCCGAQAGEVLCQDRGRVAGVNVTGADRRAGGECWASRFSPRRNLAQTLMENTRATLGPGTYKMPRAVGNDLNETQNTTPPLKLHPKSWSPGDDMRAGNGLDLILIQILIYWHFVWKIPLKEDKNNLSYVLPRTHKNHKREKNHHIYNW